MEAGGKVSGVLADSLEKTVMNREHRNLLIDGQLVLISPYDPSAGFNVGHAMQRNKLIYALADASLVVSSDLNKGGTWTGATEQLDKLRLVPVYVRSVGESSEGLDALLKKGAVPWPNPQGADEFESIFDVATPTTTPPEPTELSLFSKDGQPMSVPSALPEIADVKPASETAQDPLPQVVNVSEDQKVLLTAVETVKAAGEPDVRSYSDNTLIQADLSPADTLFAAVREVMQRLLDVPMKEAEVANAMEVSTAQAKTWLQRLVDEGVVEKQKKPVSYKVKQSRLFD